MPPVAHLVKKESLLLLRDRNALLLLFVMPAIFILIMSLALQSRFAAENGVKLDYWLVNQDSGELTAGLLQRLDTMQAFHAVAATRTPEALARDIGQGDIKFLLVIPHGFGEALAGDAPLPLQVRVAEDVTPQTAQLFTASVRGVLGQVVLHQFMLGTGLDADSDDDGNPLAGLLEVESARTAGEQADFPSSVQQNVPAWLLFAMFFIAIPLSTTWVAERDQGTYARLRSMGVGAAAMLAGKLTPYVVINLLQVLLMLMVGVYLVPLLGGERLQLGHAPGALALVSLAASFAAVSWALLVANLVTSSEQATIFTGVANLLMAALGGIMVPRFVMPESMQAISQFSPMAWGLDGFLDVILRGGGIGMVVDSLGKLVAFGLLCLACTAAWMAWRRGKASG